LSSIALLTKQDISKNLIEPFFIPESTPLHKQIQTFKVEKLRVGLIIDEYGNVQGLVTLDDLLQELVGEIISDEPDVMKQADGSFLVDASITIRELNRINNWELPIEGPKTLNGLIIEFMEMIPKPGTSVKLHGYTLEIIKRDKNTIKSVKFHPQNKK
jgi:Mg2+/Co2+ transporter CorB